jgi:hypothetical protein
MKTLRRDQVIDKLLSSRIDTAMIDPFWLSDILENGIKGLSDYTNNELTEEYLTEFGEKVKIR